MIYMHVILFFNDNIEFHVNIFFTYKENDIKIRYLYELLVNFMYFLNKEYIIFYLKLAGFTMGYNLISDDIIMNILCLKHRSKKI